MKVREYSKRGTTYWRVDLGMIDGRRVIRQFQTRGAAERFAADRRARLRTYGQAAAAMPPGELAAILALRERAAAAGITLPEALSRGLNARPTGRVTVAQVVDAVVKAKRSAGRRERYVRNLEYCLSAFSSGREHEPIDNVTPSDIESFVGPRASNPSSRSTWLNRISTLFSFALRNGWVAVNPVTRIERPTIEQAPPEIWTPGRAARALVWTRREAPALLAWLALGLFAGLRPEEADRIEWGDVNFETSTVRVDAAASKVRQRRIVDLAQSAVYWLREARRVGGRLPIPQATRRKLQRRLRERLGLREWPKDVLRHTAASYMIATTQDVARVATQLGNSPGILLRHYRELVSADDARRFWGLLR